MITTASTVYSQDIEKINIKDKIKGFFNGWKDADPFQMSGTIGLNARSYHAINSEDRQAPFTWHTNASVNISIYKLKIPISAMVSAQNQTISHPFHKELLKGFSDRRFVRVGASPYYKWAKLHLGHRSMNFSPFTVANTTFLGGGIELTPGKIRFATFYGGMAKTEPRDLALLGLNRQIFNRKGLGVKAGYGNSQNFIDFILFQAKDDPNIINPLNQDSVVVFQNDNAVLGINGQMTLFEKFNFKMELASSGFTKNAVDPEGEDSSPPIPKFLLDNRSSTVYRKAINAGLTYQAGIFSLGMGYKRIEPEYRSLGAYSFNSDFEDYTLNFGFGLFKKRLRVNTTGGIQRNNLFGEKAIQNNRTIGSLNINYSLNKVSVGFNYSNNTSQIDYVLNSELDSLNAVVITENMAVNASYTLLSQSKNRHTFSTNFSVQQVSDQVEEPTRSGASQMINGVLSYALIPQESSWKINFRLNYNRSELSQMLMNRYGVSLGLNKSIIPDIWSLAMTTNYFYSKGEAVDNQTLNIRLNSPIRISEKHRVDFGVLYLNRTKSGVVNNGNFQEFTGILTYVYSFNLSKKSDVEDAKIDKK